MSEETIRVLLVDDHELVREGLAVLIAKDPQIVVIGQCGDGLKALDMVKDLSPDVVVLDIRLGTLNGLDICREIVRRAKDTSVLMLTMYDEQEFVVRALENGAAGYLLKEATAEQLAQAIKAVAAGELYLGQGVSRNALARLGRPDSDPYETLTLRERQVMQMIAEGKTNREVAQALNVAVKTIDTHRTRMMRKLNIHNVNGLIKFAFKKGIVPLS